MVGPTGGFWSQLNGHTVTGGLVWVFPEKTPVLLLWGYLSGFWHLEEQNLGEGKEQLSPMAQNAYFYLMPFLSPWFRALLMLPIIAWGLQLSYFILSRALLLREAGQGEKIPRLYLWRVKVERDLGVQPLSKLSVSKFAVSCLNFCPLWYTVSPNLSLFGFLWWWIIPGISCTGSSGCSRVEEVRSGIALSALPSQNLLKLVFCYFPFCSLALIYFLYILYIINIF